MEVCGVGSTTRGYWRQGASDLEEVKPDNIDYLTGPTLSWKKAGDFNSHLGGHVYFAWIHMAAAVLRFAPE